MGRLISSIAMPEGSAKPGTVRYRIDTVLMVGAYVMGYCLIVMTAINLLLGDGDAETFMTGLAAVFAATIICKNRRIRELEEDDG